MKNYNEYNNAISEKLNREDAQLVAAAAAGNKRAIAQLKHLAAIAAGEAMVAARSPARTAYLDLLFKNDFDKWMIEKQIA